MGFLSENRRDMSFFIQRRSNGSVSQRPQSAPAVMCDNYALVRMRVRMRVLRDFCERSVVWYRIIVHRLLPLWVVAIDRAGTRLRC
jgi:hypothetical protein